MPDYYREDVSGPLVASLNDIINASLLKSSVDTLKARFICLLMKKRLMPICTVHLFPEITHRQFKKLTQRSQLSFTELVYAHIWQANRDVVKELSSSNNFSMTLRVVLFVPSGSRFSVWSTCREAVSSNSNLVACDSQTGTQEEQDTKV